MAGTETGVELVGRLHRAFNQRHRDGFLGCLAADVVWHAAGTSQMSGTYRGRESVWGELMEPLWPSPARIDELHLVEHGEHVVSLAEAVHDFGQGEARFQTVEVMRVAGGLVAERWEFSSRQAELDRLLARGCAAAAELPQH